VAFFPISAKDCSMRLIIVSNRLPFAAAMGTDGPGFTPSPGGVASGLSSYLARRCWAGSESPDYLWFGWPGATVVPEHQEAVRRHGEKHFNVSPVFLPEESIDGFYHGFCNKTLWPLFHYRPSLARYEPAWWQEYKRVNEIFAARLLEQLRPDDVVWVHDYQLMLLPTLIREHRPDMAIGFFLHIPFPSFEMFRMLPDEWRRELIEGLLGANLLGFHTEDYTAHFLDCVLRTADHQHRGGTLQLRNRAVKAATFPMGIDYEHFAEAAISSETSTRVEALRSRCQGQKIIFSVDRLDYTKGLINRLRGYDLFLKQHPEWHEKVTFILSVAPSRIAVESYQQMKDELEQMVGRIVGTYGNVDWTPLIYQYSTLDFDEIVARYRMCDVALITPLRDGMNLVAKEFIASRPDQTGVLILSEMAGAAKEMSEALIINPFQIEDFARALDHALTMPQQEQIRRNRLLQQRLRHQNVFRWAEDFMHTLSATAQRTNRIPRSPIRPRELQATLR
jgi:trehalose 6-phosphate synthase/phosphatase